MAYWEPAGEAPCRAQCPAGIDVPRYIRFIRQGKYDKALAVIRQRIPFPSVCGSVCPAPCEMACREHHVTEAVAINALKRFVSERATAEVAPPARSTGKKVAVVGSGPAGLTAAYYLARLGHAVTVFEALAEAGGMMRVGIPRYRLPREALDRDIENIKKTGVVIKTGARVDSAEDLLRQGFDAVFLAVGAHRPVRLGIEGEDSPGVIHGTALLEKVNTGGKADLGGRVGVIGGGNVAIDSARAALRLGAKEVTVIYRRSRAEMPAISTEVKAASEEGVKFAFLTAPERISRDNGSLGLTCVRNQLGEPDSSGRRRPVPIEGSQFTIKLDSVVLAIGEAPDVPEKMARETGSNNGLSAARDTLATSRKGVFAGGDAVTGPATVIAAIAAGRRAAASIDRYLGGSGDINEADIAEEAPELLRGLPVGRRTAMPKVAADDRLAGFDEVELGFDEAMALREAARCQWCDLPIQADPKKCVGCYRCALACSFRFEGGFNPSLARIKIVPPNRSETIGEADITFTDGCDGCGICVRTCSYGALGRGQGQAVKGGA